MFVRPADTCRTFPAERSAQQLMLESHKLSARRLFSSLISGFHMFYPDRGLKKRHHHKLLNSFRVGSLAPYLCELFIFLLYRYNRLPSSKNINLKIISCFHFQILKVVKNLKEPPGPTDEDEEEEEEVYFKEASQILELYAHLEEQNLFLIQNVQETEEALEELKGKYSDTKNRLDGETETLKAQISTLEIAIEVEQQKQRALKEHTIHTVGGLKLSTGSGPSTTLDQLNRKVSTEPLMQ